MFGGMNLHLRIKKGEESEGGKKIGKHLEQIGGTMVAASTGAAVVVVEVHANFEPLWRATECSPHKRYEVFG